LPQKRPAPHCIPQRPQLFESVRKSDSHPSELLPLQLPKLALHVTTRHCPAAHALVALDNMQGVPHEPQLATSFVVLTHALPQVTGRLDGHRHVPIWQTCPLTLHTVPHIPQLFVSDVRLKHWLAAGQCVVPATWQRHTPLKHVSPPRH
jgi:hypothetical protein